MMCCFHVDLAFPRPGLAFYYKPGPFELYGRQTSAVPSLTWVDKSKRGTVNNQINFSSPTEKLAFSWASDGREAREGNFRVSHMREAGA